MNVSTWSIRNPIAACMVFVLLTLAGLMAYKQMKVQNFPDLEVPNIIITASLPGASPSQLETEVARKIENGIASVQGLKNIYTKVSDGVVSITAEFRLEKPTQEALDEIRSAVTQVRADLPADVRDPIIDKLNLSGSAIMAFALASSQLDEEGLSWFVDDAVTKSLLGVRGVGSVVRVGGVQRQVHVELDPAKLQALRVSAADVSRQLRATQLEAAGGQSDLGGSEQPMRTIATVGSAQELAALDISLPDGRHMRLDQLATIKDTIADQKSAALLNGKKVVGFEVMRSKGASEIEVGAGVLAKLELLKSANPHLTVTQAFDFVEPVQEEFDASITLLVEGAILAVIVVFLFLREWRATFVSAIALPLSVIPAFIGMHYFGFTLNVVTLLALSLVIGILVDDAIVEVENIVRHLRMGKSPIQAAIDAADEIGLAVIATTFTLIAVFLPTAFMAGIPGKFFKQFGWTATFAVFASLVVARMLTPMMAAYMLKAIHTGEEKDGFVMRWYMRAVKWCTKWRWVTAFMAGAFFVGSVMLIPLLPQGFIPADDNSQTQVAIELAPGSTLAQTLEKAEQTRLLLMNIKHVRSVYTTIGGGTAGSDPFAPGGVAEARKATLTVLMDPRGKRPVKQLIEKEIRTAMEQVSGVRSRVGLAGGSEKLLVMLVGSDALALSQAATAVEKDLRTIPGVGGISSGAALVRSEVAVRPNAARAADMGVSGAAIAETLRVATTGDYEQYLPKLNLSQRQVPIVVKLAPEARQDLSLLERLTVPGSKGPVALGQVATMEMSGGPAIIDRFNRERNVLIEVELAGTALGDATAAMKDLPAIKNLPPSVRQIEVGDAEIQQELFASFGLAMLTGVLCIFIVLVLLFKDFLQPVTILAALPLSLGGAFVGLLIADKAFSMPSLIGLIMLMGVATKNSILLVEYAIVARRGNDGTNGLPVAAPMNRWDALMDACHKRARPIVMTTIAMGAGMLPVAMSWGAGDGSFRSPMAIAVIGGLITSTFLSLLVIPVVFTFVDDFSQLCGKLYRKITRKPAPALPVAVAAK